MATPKPFLTLAAALEAGEAAQALVLREPSELGEVIEKLPWLRSLELSRFGPNRAIELPESIARLSRLESLVVAGHQLQTLPRSLESLHELRTLDVSDNHFVGLPDVLFALSSLQELRISGHVQRFVELGKPAEWGFTTVDPRLFALERLRALDLGGNRIKIFGEEVAALTELETLTLSNNPLERLPHAVGSLRKLKRLVLNGTPIGGLPASLGQLSSLRTLEVKDTKLVAVPPEVLALPNLDAKSRKLLEAYAGRKPVFEARWRTSVPALVELLGEPGTASLMHYLTHQLRGCSHDPDEYIAWLRSPLAAGVSATPEQIYAAAGRDASGGCACVLRALTL